MDLLPTPEAFFYFYSKAQGLLLFFFLPYLNADLALFAFKLCCVSLNLGLWILNGDGNLDGLLVESDLFVESEGIEGVLEVVIHHEFCFLPIAQRHQGKSFDLISDFVVHEHDKFLEHSSLTEKLVILLQIGTIENLLTLFFARIHLFNTIFQPINPTNQNQTILLPILNTI